MLVCLSWRLILKLDVDADDEKNQPRNSGISKVLYNEKKNHEEPGNYLLTLRPFPE